MKNLNLLLDQLNDYPETQNERPLWTISSSKESVLYYRRWYHTSPEASMSIQDALSCNSTNELQEKMGI